MKLSQAIAAIAGVGLAVAPIAASANTRAGSSPVYAADSGSSGTRQSGDVDDDDRIAPGLLIAALVVAGAGVAGLAGAFENSSRSRGAGNGNGNN